MSAAIGLCVFCCQAVLVSLEEEVDQVTDPLGVAELRNARDHIRYALHDLERLLAAQQLAARDHIRYVPHDLERLRAAQQVADGL